jgi:hypothetical protein
LIAVSWDYEVSPGNIAANRAISYYGFGTRRSLPGGVLYVDGQAAANFPTSEITKAIDAAASETAAVTITASRNGSTVSGTVTNTTGGSISGTVYAFAYEPGEITTAINIVQAQFTTQALSLSSHGNQPFSLSGSAGGTNKIVVVITDSSKHVLNACLIQ